MADALTHSPPRCRGTRRSLRRYSVIASNAVGAGAAANVDIIWTEVPAAPVCHLSVTTNGNLPLAGSLAMLTASCSGTPTSYTWTGCTGTSAICLTRGPGPGARGYSVTATNAGGNSTPATATVNWQAGVSTPPGLCSQFASYLYTDADWGETITYTNSFADDPAFAWNGVWVIKVSVPATVFPGTFGRASVAEFGGPSTPRDTTLSTVPRDFRATDPSGANGPLSHSTGTTTTNSFVIGASMPGTPRLQPGQTYYVNVRNWSVESSSISCSAEQKRCDALVYIIP